MGKIVHGVHEKDLIAIRLVVRIRFDRFAGGRFQGQLDGEVTSG